MLCLFLLVSPPSISFCFCLSPSLPLLFSVEIYGRMSTDLLPNPAKFHYNFEGSIPGLVNCFSLYSTIHCLILYMLLSCYSFFLSLLSSSPSLLLSLGVLEADYTYVIIVIIIIMYV